MASIRIADIVGAMQQWAPQSYQESYDNAGLICGDPGAEVWGIVCCLDSTEEVVDEAIAKGCNLIVAHHPIVFRGLKSLTGKNYVERTLIKAIKADVAIYAAHTNLDNVHTGVSHRLASVIGLEDSRILSPKSGILQKLVTFVPHEHVAEVRQAIFRAGAGVIGEYDSCSFSVEGAGTFRGSEESDPYVGDPGVLHTEAESRIETILPSHLSNAVIQALVAAHPYEEVAYDLYPLSNHHGQVGSGMIGTLPDPMSEEDFLDHLKIKLAAPVIRHTAYSGRMIRKVAVCGGAGSFLLSDAMRSGADVFVTGDFKYHEFFDADGQILIADVGHYESEQYTIDLLAEWLRNRFGAEGQSELDGSLRDKSSSPESEGVPGQELSENFNNFAVHLTEIKTNPVKYR